MKYGQVIKLLKSKGVKIEDGTRHLRLSRGEKTTTLKRPPAQEYANLTIRKVLRALGVPNS